MRPIISLVIAALVISLIPYATAGPSCGDSLSVDTDADGVCDAADRDDDNDGVPDVCDPNPKQYSEIDWLRSKIKGC